MKIGSRQLQIALAEEVDWSRQGCVHETEVSIVSTRNTVAETNSLGQGGNHGAIAAFNSTMTHGQCSGLGLERAGRQAHHRGAFGINAIAIVSDRVDVPIVGSDTRA